MAEALVFTVNIEGPISVYMQIENQIQFAIASGRLKPGDSLPSVREMSAMLGVNPNTITKSYRDLELLRIVKTRRGVGVTITGDAPKLCRAETRAMARAHLNDAVAECIASGVGEDDVKRLVERAIASGAQPYRS
ncbi:MAG TPA: GntR family transcriptional regulator [Candidatus Hydrogenedentes bacterium]|nr:GntR family transcriptional regulator [Candidatus Hydrogenedentota bacterium]HPG69104.1 GntR family transcriptional regulator [Candidatus Hydrogenedentota bacterium]